MRFLLTLFTFAALSTSALADAGHGHGGDTPEPSRTIEIKAGSMWFDPDELQIAPGTTVRFRIENTAMIKHEFSIGSERMQRMHREMMQQGGGHHGGDTQGDTMGDHHGDMSGHGGMSNHGGMQGASVTVAPGETETLVWTAPEQGERIEYACFIPGHYKAGMKGTVILNADA
ncbi:plastocyanin/azurin family copper-binding protein [Halomonas sp. HP20-15]|uniref:cupredoxin domain-containing protein n=1 Tax=Halomonas sp. HP20-15 TaxID=3085901 RepID=UPI002982A28A|nr:plastocyanin/azurin family copper-binding protein [Halomonas sp. HP20-15]MDW5376523.1 plastocyanin/azurin family copper-binding protein [Halomonas sp. HP20-15]